MNLITSVVAAALMVAPWHSPVVEASPPSAPLPRVMEPGTLLAASRTCQYATGPSTGGPDRRVTEHRGEDPNTDPRRVAYLPIARVIKGPGVALLVLPDQTGYVVDATQCHAYSVFERPRPWPPGPPRPPQPTSSPMTTWPGLDSTLGLVPLPTGFIALNVDGPTAQLRRCDWSRQCTPLATHLTFRADASARPSLSVTFGAQREVVKPWSVTMSSDGRRVSFDGPLSVAGTTGTLATGRFAVDTGAPAGASGVTILPDSAVIYPAPPPPPPGSPVRTGSPTSPPAARPPVTWPTQPPVTWPTRSPTTTPPSTTSPDTTLLPVLWTDPRAYVYVATYSTTPGQPQGTSTWGRVVRTVVPPASPRHHQPPVPGGQVVATVKPIQVSYADAGVVSLDNRGEALVGKVTLPGTFTAVTSDGHDAYALATLDDDEHTLYRVVDGALRPIAQFD